MNDSTKKKTCKCSDENHQKLRILCIHGYRQNGEVFKQKTGSFRKIVHKWADFTYITAPHKVFMVDDLSKMNELDINECPSTEEYGWFFNRDDKTFRGIRKGGPAIGFEESIQIVEDAFKEHGPFDGILGFSQGGCFVGLLCDLQQRNLLNFKFDFVVIASGFKSGSLPHLKYYTDVINLPSLHVYGENDNIIPTEMSIQLRDCFEDPIFVTHPGGHYLPASASQKKEYQKFFKLQFSQKQCISDENL